jgi:hypothetical protein
MRTFSTSLALLMGTSLLVACGGADTTSETTPVTTDTTLSAPVADTPVQTAQTDYAELMAGEWKQQTSFSMTAGDQAFTIMNGETEYDADGTFETEAMLIVDGLDGGVNSYEIELDGTWSLAGDQLSETFTAAEVDAVVDNETTASVADAIRSALGGAGTTTSTVVSINDDMIVRDVPGVGELTYTRDDD